MSDRYVRLEAQAIERRWPMTDQQRQAILGRLLKIIADPKASRREHVAAARALLSAEKQNQADEHKVVDVRVQARNIDVHSLATDLGIDAALIEDASRAIDGVTSGDPSRTGVE